MFSRFNSPGRGVTPSTTETKTVKIQGREIKIILKQASKQSWRAICAEPRLEIERQAKQQALQDIVKAIRQNYIIGITDSPKQTKLGG